MYCQWCTASQLALSTDLELFFLLPVTHTRHVYSMTTASISSTMELAGYFHISYHYYSLYFVNLFFYKASNSSELVTFFLK